MQYKELTEKLVKRCLQKGADEAEVYLQSSRNLRIEVHNGDIETIQEAASHGVGFRIFLKGRMAFSSCNDFSEKAMDDAVASAIRFAENATPDENNALPDDKGTTAVEGLYDSQIFHVPMQEKIELAKRVEKLAMKDVRITKSGGARYSEGDGEIFLASSQGLLKSYKSSSCSLYTMVVAERGEQKSTGDEMCSRRFFSDLETPETIAEKAAKNAYEMLDPQMIKTQRAAVIFDPDVAYAILGGILQAIHGERVLQGASFLARKLDQKITTELVSLIDDGTLPKGLRSKPFDGEGVPTQKRVIVDRGILKGFMYNTIVAKRAGVKSTGNGVRRGYRNLPEIGPHHFYMSAGNNTPQDIIKATERGLYLKEVTGYGINPFNGNFSGGASGFWVENGEIVFPVKGLTVAGAGLEMLNGIDMVADDLDVNRGFMGLSTPTFRIKEMQIGGE